tara:strand:+ start:472 stop:834 length:363 start_codon:yes stop_codon:yes gene_type:complete
MVTFISLTLLLYLIQLILPNALKAGTGYAKRAAKALKNLNESLAVFLALAILSIVFSVDENIMLALYWLITRLVFAAIYILGLGLDNKSEESQGPDKQPLRSFVWAGSIVILIAMTLNLS